MTKEELLTLRDILTDFRKGLVERDYVEAHVAVLVDEAREAGYHCGNGPSAKETLQRVGSSHQE